MYFLNYSSIFASLVNSPFIYNSLYIFHPNETWLFPARAMTDTVVHIKFGMESKDMSVGVLCEMLPLYLIFLDSECNIRLLILPVCETYENMKGSSVDGNYKELVCFKLLVGYGRWSKDFS